MEKKLMIDDLRQKHLVFVEFLESLSKQDFEFHRETKWSAGQELDHILKSLEPLSDVLGNKAFIANKFGKGNGVSSDFETLVGRYKDALAQGGKAFGQFSPERVHWDQKADLLSQLQQLIEKICEAAQTYTEEELNELRLPHPLLGMLTIREMLYFTSYHVLHHQNNLRRNLGR